VLGLASEQDQRAVQDWYASHPREASEEAEHWTRLTAESAERRQERHEWREERRAGGASRLFLHPTCNIQSHILKFQPFVTSFGIFHAFNDLFSAK
jgi:hypothetical protein